MKNSKILATAGAICALSALPGTSALALTCADYFVAGTYGVDNNQNGALDLPGYTCNIGTDGNTPEAVETALLAALGAGWERLDKTDDNAVYDGSWPNPLTMTPDTGANQGEWSLADGIWGAFDRLVLVIKDGTFDPNGKDLPPTDIKWIWYEISAGDYSGDWFLGEVINCNAKAPNDNGPNKSKPSKSAGPAAVLGDDEPGGPSCRKNISHAELFGFGDGPGDENDVPEPGSLLLLGLGVLGIGASRRWRSSPAG